MPDSPSSFFPLSATLLLHAEDSRALSANQVESRLKERIPGVIVDRERGDRHVTANLTRLVELGTPEILLTGERSLIGRTLHVEFPVEGYPGVTLSGYTCGFTYYDGCIELNCEPFNLETLKTGALMFGERMELTVSLSFGDTSEIQLELCPGTLSFEEILLQKFPYFTSDEFRRQPVTDWPVAIATACRNWLARYPERQIPQAWVERRGVPSASIPQLIERLQSIGHVQDCTAASHVKGYHDCFHLAYANWTGLLMLPGVPGTVLK